MNKIFLPLKNNRRASHTCSEANIILMRFLYYFNGLNEKNKRPNVGWIVKWYVKINKIAFWCVDS